MTATLLPAACTERAAVVRLLALRAVVRPAGDVTPTTLSYRLAWDAPAASEYPRPMLADALDVETLRPDLADETWHHVGGATILGPLCGCASPAQHRDALVALAERVGSGT